jgi:hypothetical protein
LQNFSKIAIKEIMIMEEIQSTVLEGEVTEVVGENPGIEEESPEQLQARVGACNQEVAAVLNKYGCTLDPSFTIRGNGQVFVNIRILPVDTTQK